MVTALSPNSLPDALNPVVRGPEEQDLLHHLLEVEAQAAALVEDAQSEADRRIVENEKQCRAAYDEAYTREAEELEKRYQQEYEAVKAEYQHRLAAYRESLGAMPVYGDNFSKLVESLLFREC
jgi:regulator of protease activity HflC (stomatin/prohibitin superfamily)